MSRQLFLVAYDIRNSRRLYRIHRILKDYASGGQRSAFECYLSAAERKELLERAGVEINSNEDTFLIIRITSPQTVKTLGKAVKPADEFYTYLC